jgi:hypothetical protein
MAQLRAMLNERRGDKHVEDWAVEINQVVDPDQRIRFPTLYSYLNGHRPVTGKGARSLAQYFYRQHDYDMVNAISQLVLGVPYSNGQ